MKNLLLLLELYFRIVSTWTIVTLLSWQEQVWDGGADKIFFGS